MKKIFNLCFLVWLCSISIWANPINVQSFDISEFLLLDDGWQMELSFPYYSPSYLTIDSIWVYSSTDSAKWDFKGTYSEGEFLLVLTNDSLSNELTFDSAGDNIQVNVYYYESEQDYVSYYSAYLYYGNHKSCDIKAPDTGQSIVYMPLYSQEESYVYAFDNSPGIGFENDTAGVCGYLEGTLYDSEGNAITNAGYIFDYPFTTDQNGQYKIAVCARTISKNSLYSSNWEYSEIETLSLLIEPETVYSVDIHIAGGQDINEDISSKLPYRIYPNPAADKIIIVNNIQDKGQVRLVDINGKIIMDWQTLNSATTNELTLPLKIQSGIYLIEINYTGTDHFTKRIVINPFE